MNFMHAVGDNDRLRAREFFEQMQALVDKVELALPQNTPDTEDPNDNPL